MLIMRQHTNADTDKDKWRDLSGFKRDATVTNPYMAGYSGSGTPAQSIGADYKLGFRVYVATPMTVTKFTAYINNTGTGHAACNVRPVLYADSAGSPAALVASGTPLAVADNAAAGWRDLTISASLATGWYWMFLHGDANAAGLNIYMSTTSGYSGAVAYNSDTYSDGPSDPAGTVTAINGRLSLYLTASDFTLWTGAGTANDPYALTLNGSQQYAATSVFEQASGEWTIEAWAVNIGQRVGYGQLAYPLVHGATDTDGWAWKHASSSSLQIQLMRAGGNQIITSSVGLTAGVLTHLVFRCSNNALTGRWSANGVHQTAVSLTAAMVPSTSRPFYLGTYGGATHYCAPWKFSAVRYYSRVLTDAEVAQNYGAGPHGQSYVKDSLLVDFNAARNVPLLPTMTIRSGQETFSWH